MNFEDLQKSWQAQDARKKITINADVLLNEVRANQLVFRMRIFLRDAVEVGVAALLVPYFIVAGLRNSWTLHLCALGCFVVGGYFVLDRLRQRKKTPDRHGSLKDCAMTSLAEVSHQIWLLENVLWWYLLPIFVPIMVFFCWVGWRVPGPATAKMLSMLPNTIFVVLLYIGIYWLNQFAVRKNLKPRRQELEKLLAEIEPDSQIPTMKTNKPLGPLLIVLAGCASGFAVQPILKTNLFESATPVTGIAAICKANKLPALAVVVTKDGKICDRAAAGVRKWGDPTPVTTNDVFHIGSCTKSMTATLAAMFIEQGKLRWDTTIVEMFPELKGKMSKEYEAVTVEQLLHHRGGVPHDPPAAAWARAWKEIGTPMQQRREYLEAVLSAPPEAAPGTKMIYSNDGYVIVGVMLEKISGQGFESLMTERLFKPLHMDTAGFGSPGTKDKTDQPWGHVSKLFTTTPSQSDNPPVHSPCGRVHCSLEDLARYAMFHLQGGTNGLLKPETMARLHASPVGVEMKDYMDNYACGWVRLERSWAGGTVLWHNGSNTMWYIVMWLAPEKNFCVITASNIYGEAAQKGCDDAAVMMIEKWLPEK